MTKRRGNRFKRTTLAPEEPAQPAIEQDAAADPTSEATAATDIPVTHRAVCSECSASVTYSVLSSGHGFMVLESSEPDGTTFGAGENGRPLCPRDHGEMHFADEQIPVADAIAQAAEQLAEEHGNGHGTPQQRALFNTAKPFNLDGALDAITEKNRAVKWAHDRYDEAKQEAADARKTWEREAKQLQDLIDDLNDKRTARAAQVEAATEEAGAVAQEPAGEAIAEPAGGDTGDEAFTSETPVEAAEPEHATV